MHFVKKNFNPKNNKIKLVLLATYHFLNKKNILCLEYSNSKISAKIPDNEIDFLITEIKIQCTIKQY